MLRHKADDDDGAPPPLCFRAKRAAFLMSRVVLLLPCTAQRKSATPASVAELACIAPRRMSGAGPARPTPLGAVPPAAFLE